MRIAIFSDLHNLTSGFHIIMRETQRQNVDRLIYLGDLGSNLQLFASLRSREISCIFGNWEVSGLRRLPPQWAEWVTEWPAKIEIGDICYTHATPDIPVGIATTGDALAYMSQGVGWGQLFPRLHHDEEARWAALAALETNNQRAAFHGHTHVQRVWVYELGRWRSFNGPAEFALDLGTPQQPTRYLIGVGSAGDPQDGRALRYVIYDDVDQSVRLLAVSGAMR